MAGGTQGKGAAARPRQGNLNPDRATEGPPGLSVPRMASVSDPVSDLFSAVSFDRERFGADMRKSGARKCYGIFFTPRSGSSWLTELLSHAGRLGQPEEWFNPAFVPKVAQSINADGIMNYVKMLKRKKAPGGLFGFEVTYYQMLRTFGGEAAFLSHFPAGFDSVFLLREDIVLQAVSLAKSVKTEVYHAAHSPADDIARADRAFRYDAKAIGHWLRHILDQETRFDRFFAAHGIDPLPLSYEMMMRLGRDHVLALIAAQLNEDPGTPRPFEERHRKIGTERNQAFAARFASENPALVRSVAERRAHRLSALGLAPAGGADAAAPEGVPDDPPAAAGRALDDRRP